MALGVTSRKPTGTHFRRAPPKRDMKTPISALPSEIGEFHAVILDSINDGVFTVDRQWKITSFNRAAERITGVSRQDAVGRPCCEVLRASICEAACALRQTLATSRPVVNKAIYILGAKGQRIPISISTAVFKDRRGRVIGGAETFRDLSLVEELRQEFETQHSFANIVGRSPSMRPVFQLLPLLAESESTVLIEGASGTGKELFARAIHSLGAGRLLGAIILPRPVGGLKLVMTAE